jgi:hypothetical protein
MTPTFQRQELGEFLGHGEPWRILKHYAVQQSGHIFDMVLFTSPRRIGHFRIYAFGTADYSIRPPDPARIEGGPDIVFSTDDLRLAAPSLQQIPGGDGEAYDPPKRYQLLKLDQSWIIAERFEIESL